MPESFVQVAADGAGKRFRTFERTISPGVTAHDQMVLIAGLPTYYIQTPYRANTTTAANFLDIFNGAAAGSNISVVIKKLFIQPYAGAAVTGVSNVFTVNKTTSVGTGGTAIVPRSMDSTDPAIPATVTSRHLYTGGAAVDHVIMNVPLTTEETTAAAYFVGMNAFAEGNETRDLHLNPGEGMSVTLAAQTATTSGYSILAVICVA